jgi:hypothetical protein
MDDQASRAIAFIEAIGLLDIELHRIEQHRDHSIDCRSPIDRHPINESFPG